MDIKELQKRCFKQAVAKGWVERPVLVPEQVALICSEACEALESYRSKEPIIWFDTTKEGKSKPCGISSEYADIVIRVCHYATLLGFDLESAIQEKLDYNASRPYQHGGKLA